MLSVFILTALALCQIVSAGPLNGCTGSQFECDNGECIDAVLKCDGDVHCKDGSDEEFTTCFNSTCNYETQFRCNYGGCVSMEKKCNGQSDCADQSDENDYVCAYERDNIDELMTRLRGSCSRAHALGCDELTKNPKCLKWSQVCNGHQDCSNGIDESFELCAASICPPDSFRCKNGACINSNEFCNLKINCVDGSDELPQLCNKTQLIVSINRPLQQDGSAIDLNMINVWNPIGCKVNADMPVRLSDYFTDFSYAPEAIIPHQTFVTVNCDSGFVSFGSDLNLCKDTEWVHPFNCMRVCDQHADIRDVRYSTECINDEALVRCNDNTQNVDTTLLVTCAPGYRSNTVDSPGRHTCNENGLWTTEEENPNCEAICGVKSKHHPDIIPWTVSIFQRSSSSNPTYNFKCLGTILTPYIVITAENCFSDITHKNRHIDFTIAEGNHSVSFTPGESHGYELRSLSEIHIVSHDKSYKIALVSVAKPFVFGDKVKPICLKTNTIKNEETQTEGVFGNHQLGEGLTHLSQNEEYTLIHVVVNSNLKYRIEPFLNPIIDEMAMKK